MVINQSLPQRLVRFLQNPIDIAPLVVLRMILGAMVIFSTARFLLLGWVESHFTSPTVHFTFYGFEWVKVLPPVWMYILHGLLLISALAVFFGCYFRIASVLVFVIFTYFELVDLTYYLNHYYFVSLMLFMLMFTPAHHAFSVDSYRLSSFSVKQVPRFWMLIFQLMLVIVYVYAGLAKINYDWIMEALPLKIWLPSQDNIPIIGSLFTWKITPYLFSWIGMIYDCTIVFFLLNRFTRPSAYILVVVFHLLTALLFQIGVFPWVMIGATLIFFSPAWHRRILDFSEGLFGIRQNESATSYPSISKYNLLFFSVFFAFQLLFPWRYLLYPGNLYWTEEGYRFSWRVMLMEKAGTATFYVKDGSEGKAGMVDNRQFLNSHQETQMSTQPDMILQYAHIIRDYYLANGMQDPQVNAEVYVTLNARPSELLINPTVNLATINDSWQHKSWINPAPN